MKEESNTNCKNCAFFQGKKDYDGAYKWYKCTKGGQISNKGCPWYEDFFDYYLKRNDK